LFLRALVEDRALNLLAFCALDDPLDVDALQVDILRSNLSILNDLIGLDDRDLCILAHSLVEIVLCLAELAVTETIGFGDLNEGVVSEDRFFENVGFAVEFAGLLGRSHLGDSAIGVVADWKLTGLDYIMSACTSKPRSRNMRTDCAVRCRCVESWNTSSASGALLSNRTLRSELEAELTLQVHLFKNLIISDVTCNHGANLLCLQELAKTNTGHTRVVAYDPQVLDV
jgi:hypothetical protein